MKHALSLFILFAVLMGGCRPKEEKPKEEAAAPIASAKPVMVELVTGDFLYLDLMVEEPDAYLLRGRAGTGRFPKAVVRRVLDAAPQAIPFGMGAPQPQTQPQPKAFPKYIAKIGSRTFHLSTCRQCRYISEKDRVELESREEAFERGFEPCNICNP